MEVASPQPAFSLADHRTEVYKKLEVLYDDGSQYDGLSQYAHACQAAWQADEAGADDATVVAALLHDVGWKLAGAEPLQIDNAAGADKRRKHVEAGADACDAMEGSLAARLGILSTCAVAGGASAEQQRAQHDLIGATFLRMCGLEEKVATLIEGHVLAKRFLCFKEADYHAKLSAGSKTTLKFQGGPMSAAEASVFESDPLFEANKQMRRWDEAAKIVDLEVPPFSTRCASSA